MKSRKSSSAKNCEPVVRRAVHAHERNMHPGKKETKIGRGGARRK
jgi:hypothetical protein